MVQLTEHCLFVAESAAALADKVGVERVDTASLPSEESFRRLKEYQTFNACITKGHNQRTGEAGQSPPFDHDTVGAVAVDCHGNLAAATSTGGITGKQPGRVGDTPLPGSGGWADNEGGGAVSTTGHGEAILRVCLAKKCASFMEDGLEPQEAAKRAIGYLERRIHGAAGIICVDRKGQIGVYFNTERMVWASVAGSYVADDTKVVVGGGVFLNELPT